MTPPAELVDTGWRAERRHSPIPAIGCLHRDLKVIQGSPEHPDVACVQLEEDAMGFKG